MAMIDIYRSNLLRKRNEYATLSQKKAQISSKIATEQSKQVSINHAISQTKSLQTVKSKVSELARSEKTIADLNKDIADVDKKMAQKQKEILDEEKHIETEEKKNAEKKIQEDKKRMQEIKNSMQTVNATLLRHEHTQNQIKREIDVLKYIPPVITVLFLASSPKDEHQLWLDEEARSIEEIIRKAEYRDSVKFVTRWALRPFDILQAINETNPAIVHFSGHGTDNGELVLEDNNCNSKLVSIEAISQTMATSSDTIKLVFFNACHSGEQAQSVVNYIDAAIGMSDAIGDEAAKVFASQFYSSISFGLSLERSFNQAKAMLLLEGIPEEDIPVLFTNSLVNQSDYYLVQPKED
jgi:hypothetical protein